MRLLLSLLLANLAAIALQAQQQSIARQEFTRGVYGDLSPLMKRGYSFSDIGVNAVFVRSVSLNAELYSNAWQENVKVFVEFPTLNGKDYLKSHPEAWPINEKGERAPEADWFMGICPTHRGFREYRENQLRSLLTRYEVDGIWLDYLHWHAQFETPDPILPETCFCDRCTSAFAEAGKLSIPGHGAAEKAEWILREAEPAWRKWRSGVLNEWVSGMKSILNSMQPGAALGIFYCSWYPHDYDSALYRTLGIDLQVLAGIADVFSPMLYHERKGKPIAWVQEYVTWLGTQPFFADANTAPKLWPIVQANNIPGRINAEDFREVMLKGASFPSTGIMMFSDHALVDDPKKLKVMRELYKPGKE